MKRELDKSQEKLMAITKMLSPYLAVFPSCKIDTVGLVLYAKALQPLSLPVIEAALTKLLQTSVFFPSVAEIFKEADEMERFALAKTSGFRVPTAAEAWEEVQKLVKDCYVYKKWEFSCPQVEKAAKQFGIKELCVLESNAVNTARAQFMRIYDSIVNQNLADRQNQRALDTMSAKSLSMLAGSVTNLLEERGGA